MKAMKCDRCGKIYVEGDGRNIKTITIHKQDWNGDYPWEAGFIDLCPSCLDELVDFLANKEETPPFIQGTVDLPPIEGISEKDLEYLTDHMGEEFTKFISQWWSSILTFVKKGTPPRKLFENKKEEVEHTCCCCEEKKSNMNADPVKGILDEALKVDRVSPLEIHFGGQFFTHYNVKGENEDE